MVMSPTEQKIDDFFSKYPEIHHARRQMLIYAGEDPPGVFYLVSGQVKQYAINDAGAESIVNMYQEPAVMPISWAINHKPNNYFYECFSDVTARKAPSGDFEEFLRANPDVVYELLGKIYASVDDLHTRMAYMMGETARNRVIMELILECKKYGIKKPDGSYVLKIHESDIAARTGLSRETISRHMSQISNMGLIQVGRKEIVIRDIQLLEKELDQTLA